MNFKIFWILCSFVLLSPTPVGSEFGFKDFMVVWNVGQGQWATLKDSEGCHHFDMGGERDPSKAVAKLCGLAENYIYLSHWDLDHISFVEKSARILQKRCLVLGPLGRSSTRKTKWITGVPRCSQSPKTSVHELTSLKTLEGYSSNDLSHVLLAADRFLLPGDSTRAQEVNWSQSPFTAKAQWLLLGHHGSRTSTSEVLLKRLPHLKVAISSARFRRYGHPHIEVVGLLHYYHIPLLRTEDWGNLWFELATKRTF
jgi:competence protein ComEC